MKGPAHPLEAKIEFISAHPTYIPKGYHYESHCHLYNELVLIQQGRYRSRVAGVDRIASPGDILLYPQGMVHEEWVEDSQLVLTWACTFKQSGQAFIFCHDTNGRVQELLAQLTGDTMVAHFPKKQKDQRVGALFEMLLVELRELVRGQPMSMVEQVRRYIRNNLPRVLTLDELSAVVGLSKYHFARQYHAHTGRTPMEDVRFLRAEEARKLILNTTLPLCSIAPQVGLPDEFRLSRLLKGIFGVGARELRQPARTHEE